MIQSALLPLQQQLRNLSSPSSDSAQLNDLRLQQKQLAIESKSAALSTPGGRSQYRCIANLQLDIANSLDVLDSAVTPQIPTDNPLHAAITLARNHLSSAATKAADRIDLILLADSDPRHGWKALNLYEEKQRQPNSNPEKMKVWNSCIKAAQESSKPKPAKGNRFQKPFRSEPGSEPGRSQHSGRLIFSLFLVYILSDNLTHKSSFLSSSFLPFSFLCWLGLL